MFVFLFLDTQIDFSTTPLPTFGVYVCENQTQTPLDEIQDRINVVVPYLVILGKRVDKLEYNIWCHSFCLT